MDIKNFYLSILCSGYGEKTLLFKFLLVGSLAVINGVGKYFLASQWKVCRFWVDTSYKIIYFCCDIFATPNNTTPTCLQCASLSLPAAHPHCASSGSPSSDSLTFISYCSWFIWALQNPVKNNFKLNTLKSNIKVEKTTNYDKSISIIIIKKLICLE